MKIAYIGNGVKTCSACTEHVELESSMKSLVAYSRGRLPMA